MWSQWCGFSDFTVIWFCHSLKRESDFLTERYFGWIPPIVPEENLILRLTEWIIIPVSSQLQKGFMQPDAQKGQELKVFQYFPNVYIFSFAAKHTTKHKNRSLQITVSTLRRLNISLNDILAALTIIFVSTKSVLKCLLELFFQAKSKKCKKIAACSDVQSERNVWAR